LYLQFDIGVLQWVIAVVAMERYTDQFVAVGLTKDPFFAIESYLDRGQVKICGSSCD